VRKKLLSIAISLFFIWVSGFGLFLRHIQTFENLSSHPCDAVVVFTGKGKRIQAAYTLFQSSNARGFLVSGVEHGVELDDLEINDLKFDGITLGYESYNTHTNALETALWTRKNSFSSICLVTGLYHMPRSLLELRAFLPEVTIQPHAVTPPKLWIQSRKQFFYIISEYHKFCLTHLIQWMGA